jgi:hypothetical protein
MRNLQASNGERVVEPSGRRAGTFVSFAEGCTVTALAFSRDARSCALRAIHEIPRDIGPRRPATQSIVPARDPPLRSTSESSFLAMLAARQ